MDLIDPALPNNLYVTAKACQKSPVFGQDIYSITGGEVVLDEAKAENIINGNNVYAENEFQQKLGESIISWVETGNYLIQQFGTLDFKHAMAFPWSLEAKMFPSLDKLKIEPSQIRYILQNQG